MPQRPRLSKAKVPNLLEVLELVREVLVPHHYDNFSRYKRDLGPWKGSSRWAREAQDLVIRRLPFFEKEFEFHAKCGSAFDLYSAPHDLVVELAMFQGKAYYELWKLLLKMLIAGPSYAHLAIAMPQTPGLRQLREPFNHIALEVFERTHHFKIHWILLDAGPKGWVGSFEEMVELELSAIRPAPSG